MAALFEAHKAKTGMTRKQFAERYKMPGGQAVISQHTAGLRPISLKQARAYMDGFACSLRDISPTLAVDVQAVAANTAPADDGTPAMPTVAPLRPTRAADGFAQYIPQIDSALKMLRAMDPDLLDDAHGLIEHIYKKQLTRSKVSTG